MVALGDTVAFCIVYRKIANSVTNRAAAEGSPGSEACVAAEPVADAATVAFTKFGPH